MNEPVAQRRHRPGDDDATARRLTATLQREATRVQPPADAWARFSAGIRRSAGGRPPDARPRCTAPRRASGWHSPLIAAAAVAAIVIVTAVTITGRHPTTGTGGIAPASGARSVASAALETPTVSAVRTGSATVRVAPAADCPAVPASAATIPVDTWHITSSGRAADGAPAPSSTVQRPSLRMFFVDRSPRLLCASVEAPAGTTQIGPADSDGTPLGYLRLATVAELRYLWGAVGPAVTRVDISAMLAPADGDPNPSELFADLWELGAVDHQPWVVPDYAPTTWTDLGSGWHGFAVQLPADATTADVTAFDAGDKPLQDRSLDPADGTATDRTQQPAAPASMAATAPPSTGPTGTIGLMPGAPIITAADATPAQLCSTAPPGRGDAVVDTGDEGPPVRAYLGPGETSLCFFDGHSWYVAEPNDGFDQTMLFFGVTKVLGVTNGTGSAGSTQRLVFGAVGSATTHLTATDGIEQIGPLRPLPGTTLRLFVMRTGPGAGSVTAGDGTGHQVTQQVTRIAGAASSAEPSRHG